MELSDVTSIVTTTLEARGVLGKIRAELRASVFSAIHEQQQKASTALPVLLLHQDDAGRAAAQLVLDLLQHCQLDYSHSVLIPEADLKETGLSERRTLAGALNLDVDAAEPLLVQLVRAALTGEVPEPTGEQLVSASRAARGLPGEVHARGSQPVEAAKPLSINIASKAAEFSRSGGGPLTPPSPSSPLLSVPTPQGLNGSAMTSSKEHSKPKCSSAYLADLPPLGGPRAAVPSLCVGGSSVPPPPPAADDERRLDALESKLAGIGGPSLPIRAAAGPGQLAPLAHSSSRNQLPLPPTAFSASGGSSTIGSGGGPALGMLRRLGCPRVDGNEDVIEDDIAEESFEEDEGAELSYSLGGGGNAESGCGCAEIGSCGPPLLGTASPSHLSRLPMDVRHTRLSPLDASLSSIPSVDESVSPGRLTHALQGFDLAESIERP